MDVKIISSGSSGNALTISDSKTTILIDCGIPWKKILLKGDFIAIDACLVSHSHL